MAVRLDGGVPPRALSLVPSAAPTTVPTATPGALRMKDGFDAPAARPAARVGALVTAALPVLQQGSKGTAVVNLQQLLKTHGFDPGAADGIFGPQTESAVRAFQSAKHLGVDGIVGPQTWAALNAIPATSHPVLQSGSSGAAVSELQTLLNKNGAHLAVDGQFGPATASAVRSYQSTHGLATDGVVGPQTWNALLKGTPSVPPPPPPTGGTFASRILAQAASQIGYHEGANNSNKFSDYFGRHNEPWCADFVSYCATKAGVPLNIPGAQHIQDALEAQGKWKGKANPKPGDVVTFDWTNNGWDDHVGLVESVFVQNGKTYITTIEGNSSDQVKRNTYPLSDPNVIGFGTLG